MLNYFLKYCLNINFERLRIILLLPKVEKIMIIALWGFVKMILPFHKIVYLAYYKILTYLHTNITQRPTLGVKITTFGWGNVAVMWAWFSHLLVDLWHVKVELRWKMTIETATIKNLASIRLVIKSITPVQCAVSLASMASY